MTGRKKGSVLIVVLLVLAAAAVLMLETGKLLRVDYEGASYQRVLAAGGNLLRSGMTIARELLLDDIRESGDLVDHQFESWGQADSFILEISEPMVSGDLTGRIEAEDGRLSLNELNKPGDVADRTREVFLRLVSILVEDHALEADPKDYLTSIRIWLGAKDTQGDDAWYALAEPGYSLHGRPFTTINELALVRWKDVADEDRFRVLHGSDSVPGLLDLVTVWGEGRINVNTAPSQILEALCGDPNLRQTFVEEMEAYRQNVENDFSSTWFKDVANRVGLDMATFPAAVLGVKSTVFRVSLTANVGAGRLRSTSIVRRMPERCVVLFENIH